MNTRGGELVATDESAIVSEPLLDAIVVEDGQSYGRFPDTSWTDESEWSEVLCKANDLLDQLVAPKADP